MEGLGAKDRLRYTPMTVDQVDYRCDDHQLLRLILRYQPVHVIYCCNIVHRCAVLTQHRHSVLGQLFA